jgi:cytochrome P450
LPYCEAIVNEALRFFARYTPGLPHRAVKDTKLCGFDIPRDTMVVPMLSSLANNEKVYKYPDEFNPENFLDQNGKLQIPDKHFPFGLGKRRCIGESLARGNLFLMCTTLLQNFYFEVPPGHDLPSDEPVEGATATVQDYEALIVLRN